MVAIGDGSIKLFDIALDEFPVQSWQEHKREVFAVHWNLITKDTFCSSSWDGTIKIVLSPLTSHFPKISPFLHTLTQPLKQWSPDRHDSILTLPTHTCTYSAAFSPHNPSLLSAVSSDSHLRIFDIRTPASASNHLTLTIPLHAPSAYSIPPPHEFPPSSACYSQPETLPPAALALASSPPSEALTHDWNKYRPTILAAAGVDRFIRTFDLRAPSRGPLIILAGHDYAVRKLAWSPHAGDILLSASYDMTCRVWTDGTSNSADGEERHKSPITGAGGALEGGRELGQMSRHTEFAMGVDWCLFGGEGWCASCGWDERVLVWDVKAVMGS